MGETPQIENGQLSLAGDTWARGLAGLSNAQIASGLAACATGADDWPPALPRFRMMCFGIPSLASVRHSISSNDDAPFTALVREKLDTYAFKHADRKTMHHMLRDAYELAHAHVMRGGALPVQSSGQIEAPMPPQRKNTEPAIGRKFIAELSTLLAGVPAESKHYGDLVEGIHHVHETDFSFANQKTTLNGQQPPQKSNHHGSEQPRITD